MYILMVYGFLIIVSLAVIIPGMVILYKRKKAQKQEDTGSTLTA
jgi:hypothetical protein